MAPRVESPPAEATVGQESALLEVGGPLVELRGAPELVERFSAELGVAPGRGADIVLEVTDSPEQPGPGATVLGSVAVEGARVRLSFERSGISIGFELDGGGTLSGARAAVVDRPMPYRIPRPLFRWVEPTNLPPERLQDYVFVHLVLESLVLLSGTAAPLHAAAVSRNGRATVLTSAGGVGKTSTAMELIRGHGFGYLTDDIAMLAAGEPLSAYRRLPMVYSYNLEAHRELAQRIKADMSTLDRIHWLVGKPVHGSGRRRRVDPSTIHGREVIQGPAEIATVAFLVRGGGTVPSVAPLDLETMVQRCTSVLHVEFADLFERLRAAEAAGWDHSVEELIDRVRATYREVLSGASRLVELRIPAGCAPGEVAGLLADLDSSV